MYISRGTREIVSKNLCSTSLRFLSFPSPEEVTNIMCIEWLPDNINSS